MIQVASLPPYAPVTERPTATKMDSVNNKTAHLQLNGYGEVDAPSTKRTGSSLRDVCADINHRVSAFLSAEPESDVMGRTQEMTKETLNVIEKALQDYDFNTLSLSYNGGKDCLVLLVLYLSALHTHFNLPPSQRRNSLSPATTICSNSSSITDSDFYSSKSNTSSTDDFPTSIPSIYAKPPDPFPAVTSFVASSSKAYHLDLTHISTNPDPTNTNTINTKTKPNLPTSTQTPTTPKITFRDAFALYLKENPSVKAIFVGTRRTDPHGAKLTHFDPTDGNWPRFMRIHPVIDWHLSEIWCFLRSPYLNDPNDPTSKNKGLDYCTMYDEGYTSLGGIGDTLRNPKLKVLRMNEAGEEVVVGYRPAYELTEDEEERLGRE